MTKMKTLTKGLLGASVFSLIAGGNAFALGTAAGTNVKNTFSLDYDVSGVGQPTISTCKTGDTGCTTETSTNFTVDRLIDLTVTSTGDTNVAPGAVDEELVFSVTNTGNDTQAYDLVLVSESGDDFDATGLNVTYYVDDGNGTFEPGGLDGAGTAYTPGDDTSDIPPDAILWVVVDGDIPATGLVDTDESEVSLIADTLEPSTSASPGTPVVADTGGNTLTGVAENVLGDGSGTTVDGTDDPNQGDHSATGTYIVASADVSASKAVGVFTQDGTGCSTIPGTPDADPLSIPGSCVEYVITASNAATATEDATAIAITDDLPAELTFITAQAAGFTGGTFSQPATNADCSAVTCTVSLTGATLTPGDTGTITIRALVQ
jgi:uncharacterized repeat protein (TIGR01451 family)